MKTLLALFGVAPRATQEVVPPALAWVLLLLAAWWGANIVDWLARLLEAAMPSLRWGVYFRTVGLTAVLLVSHSMYRAIVHGDDHSWGGWFRRLVQR